MSLDQAIQPKFHSGQPRRTVRTQKSTSIAPGHPLNVYSIPGKGSGSSSIRTVSWYNGIWAGDFNKQYRYYAAIHYT